MTDLKQVIFSLVRVLRCGEKIDSFENSIMSYKLPSYKISGVAMEREYLGMPNPFYKPCEIEVDSKSDGDPEKNYHILKQVLQVCYDLNNKTPGSKDIVASQNKEIDVLKIIMERWSKKLDYM